ncbi:hypothetical protein HP532_01400 [Pseudomonas sp. CrR25]|nr:hypothetical protein [Pseudomonas sp. CrR25]
MSLSSAGQHLFASLLFMTLPLAQAETLTPLQGQSPEQIQSDISTCQAQTGGASQGNADDSQGGERLRGAAKGAAAGAAVAEVRGRQHEEAYDRVDDDIKQEYRQNRARDAAAVGMAVGGSRQRQERREGRRNDAAADDSQQAYINCMSGRGYSVSP